MNFCYFEQNMPQLFKLLKTSYLLIAEKIQKSACLKKPFYFFENQ